MNHQAGDPRTDQPSGMERSTVQPDCIGQIRHEDELGNERLPGREIHRGDDAEQGRQKEHLPQLRQIEHDEQT